MVGPPLRDETTSNIERGLRGLMLSCLALGAIALTALGLISNVWGYVGSQERLLLHQVMSVLFSGFMATASLLIVAATFYRYINRRFRALLSASGALLFLYTVYEAAGFFDAFMRLGIKAEMAEWREIDSLLPIFILQFGLILAILVVGLASILRHRKKHAP